MSETTWFTWKTFSNGKCASIDAFLLPHVKGFEQHYDMTAMREDAIAAINKMLAYSDARTDGETVWGPDTIPAWERSEIFNDSLNGASLVRTVVPRHRKD